MELGVRVADDLVERRRANVIERAAILAEGGSSAVPGLDR